MTDDQGPQFNLSFAADRLDERGLLPLDEARRLVAEASEFRIDCDWLQTNAGPIKNTDLLWAALLSLEDVHEFSAAVRRLTWVHGPRALDRNIDPWHRFGADVVLWVADCLGEDGDLWNGCGNLPANLLMCRVLGAYDVLGYIESISGDEAAAERLRAEYIRRHRDGVVKLARQGRGLKWWRKEILKHAAVVGHPAALAELNRTRVRKKDVLRVLDEAFEANQHEFTAWPAVGLYWHPTCGHAMRLWAAVRDDSPAWCVIIERLTGRMPGELMVDAYAYGHVPQNGLVFALGQDLDLEIEPEDAPADQTVVIIGPAGTLRVEPEDLRDATLGPSDSLEYGGEIYEANTDVSRLRCYLRRFGAALWPDAAQRATALLGGPATVLVCTDRFAHSDMVPPSKLKSYRTLAKAISRRDPTLFRPGEATTWFDTPGWKEQEC